MHLGKPGQPARDHVVQRRHALKRECAGPLFEPRTSLAEHDLQRRPDLPEVAQSLNLIRVESEARPATGAGQTTALAEQPEGLVVRDVLAVHQRPESLGGDRRRRREVHIWHDFERFASRR